VGSLCIKATVVACLLIALRNGQVQKQIRTLGTSARELLRLREWLVSEGGTQVAMESTGVYWKPVWNVLEGRFTLLLVNARHVKAVPGRKTDVRDCEWLADLLRHGLLRGSFVPDRAQRELRELTRYRTALVRERATGVNRLRKTLEGANVKLGAVASNVLGRSGREILDALVVGTSAPTELAELARGRLREKLPALRRALAGSFGPHQQFLVAEQLAHIDELDERLARLDAEVAERLRPVDDAIARLDTIPGVGRRTAEILLAEIGSDLQRFPSAGHLASWAGMCPGNYESAGKRQKGKTRKGSKGLRTALVEAGQAAARKTDSYLAAQYHRLVPRLGKKKAAVAVGHSILRSVYYLLVRETTYQELGGNYFDERYRHRVEQRLVRRLEQLGFEVQLTPKDPAA
jgi:transposase